MLIICSCSQKLRIDLATVARVRCPKCRAMLAAEVARQAARNAAIVLEAAELLARRMDRGELTPAENTIAELFAKHERAAV